MNIKTKFLIILEILTNSKFFVQTELVNEVKIKPFVKLFKYAIFTG